MKTNTPLSKQVTWNQIEALISDDKYKSFLKEINPSVYKMVLDENKRPQVTASILTMLQNREPENATEEYAEEVVKLMVKVAQNTLLESQINISD